ncbi:condensation domain-containing protein [Actinoplanes sp. RD1]|uniref:condensation domain-containing protein n=1 Tax=Actinoplanes sp. RD1 TaxID=3064538 RepID=UPI002740B563|nr:condensation domain-containing protein [Actinoplanes sp. RD1]
MPADVLAWIEAAAPGHVTGAGFRGLGAWRVTGPLDVSVLRRALAELVRRHEILRTALVPGPGGFRHLPGPGAGMPLTVLDAPAPPGRELGPEVAAAVPSDGPCAVLGRHGPRDATLVLAASHTRADHWSMEVLARDLVTCYDALLHGREPVLDVRAFAAYAARTNAERTDPRRLGAAVARWRRLLHDLPPLVPPVADPGELTAEERFVLPVGREALSGAARAARTTPFACLLAAYALALSRTAGAGEVVVPLFTSGRERPDWATVGPFMNVAAVRVRPVPDAAELLAQVHRELVTALAHEQPLALLLPEVPEIGRLFHAGGVPAAGLELVQFPPSAPHPGPLGLDRLPIGPRHGATVLPPSALLCWLEADGPGYAATVRYRPGLLDRAWIVRLAEAFAAGVATVTHERTRHATAARHQP